MRKAVAERLLFEQILKESTKLKLKYLGSQVRVSEWASTFLSEQFKDYLVKVFNLIFYNDKVGPSIYFKIF